MGKPLRKRYHFNYFSVIVAKHSLTYQVVNLKTMEVEQEYHLASLFYNNSIDEEKGEVEITWKDKWGSEMTFKNYSTSSLKGMFEYIGRANGLPIFGFVKPE